MSRRAPAASRLCPRPGSRHALPPLVQYLYLLHYAALVPAFAHTHGCIPRTLRNGQPQLLLLPLHPRRSVRPVPRRRKCAQRRRHIRTVARHGRRRRRRQRCRPQRRTAEEGKAVRPTGPGRCLRKDPRVASAHHLHDHLRLAGIVHHRARSWAINRTANLRAVQREEADVAAYPMLAGYRRARPQASLLFDRHLPKLKRTMRNRNCQESCRVQR